MKTSVSSITAQGDCLPFKHQIISIITLNTRLRLPATMPVGRYESAPVDVEPLGQPLKFEFSGKVAKNRFFKAAMAEDLATWSPKNIEERGIPTKETIELYRR